MAKGERDACFSITQRPAPNYPSRCFVYGAFDFDSEYDQALLEPLAPGIDARIIRLETLLEMKRAANRLKDLADLEALEKFAPYKK